MKIKQEMLDALNEQFAKERNSAYLYEAMASDSIFKNRKGIGAWFTRQAQEELIHAEKIYGFILERGGKPVFSQLDKPQASWDSLREVFEATLEHERFISDSIITLVKKAKELDDTPTELFLSWFVTEQVEEESSVEEILVKLDQIGDDNRGIYMLDKELGAQNNTTEGE